MTARRRSRRLAPPRGGRRRSGAATLISEPEPTLLDLVDSLLDKGVVVDGELVLGLADVDLIYVRLGALLCAAERLLETDERQAARASRKRR